MDAAWEDAMTDRGADVDAADSSHDTAHADHRKLVETLMAAVRLRIAVGEVNQ